MVLGIAWMREETARHGKTEGNINLILHFYSAMHYTSAKRGIAIACIAKFLGHSPFRLILAATSIVYKSRFGPLVAI